MCLINIQKLKKSVWHLFLTTSLLISGWSLQFVQNISVAMYVMRFTKRLLLKDETFQIIFGMTVNLQQCHLLHTFWMCWFYRNVYSKQHTRCTWNKTSDSLGDNYLRNDAIHSEGHKLPQRSAAQLYWTILHSQGTMHLIWNILL